MKILTLDIETQASLAYVWRLFRENIPLIMLKESGHTICWSAKWLGEDEFFFGSIEEGMGEMLTKIHTLLDEADIIITYNGKRFDIPTLNKEFITHGYLPPAPYKHIDLYETVRRNFKFQSNKLEFVARQLGVTPKVSHRGYELWIACENHDPQAWEEMETYNKGDVQTTEEVYLKLRPWITNHPNLNLYTDGEHVCPACKSKWLQRRGVSHLHAGSYQRYKCLKCGKWSRDTHKIKESVGVRGAN